MPAGRSKKIEMPDLIAKFKEKNSNREPRDPAELVKFSKKLRGFQEISFGEARKYFSQTPRRRGRPRPKQPETKEPEETQSSEGPSSPQTQENATEEANEAADATPSYQIGDQVMVTKDRSGVIKFIGLVDFKEGTYYGIELHARYVGKCDGSRDGRRYFECPPKRGIFVQDSSIRRKMNQSDHARKDSWLAANRSSRVGRTPSPGPPAIAEEDQSEQPAPETELNEPATEEKEPSQVVADEDDAPPDEDETNVEDEQSDEAQPVEEDDVNEDEVVDEPEIQIEEKVNGDNDEREVKEEEIESPVPPPEDSGNEIISTEEPEVQIPSQPFNEEYYPAKADENLLQFIANQPDMRLRSQLMDHYMTTSDVERLERAFEHLKSFAPDEQNNLLRVDIMPRLHDCR